MTKFIIDSKINKDVFTFFHGTSSAFSASIEKEGILFKDDMLESIKTAFEAISHISAYSVDGINESTIYHFRNKEAIDRILYAYNDAYTMGRRIIYLSYFDYYALPYTTRLGGEFLSGLFMFYNELKEIVENYAYFDRNRRCFFEEELLRLKDMHGGAKIEYSKYCSVDKVYLKYYLDKLNDYREKYLRLINKHKTGVIYICRLNPKNLANSVDSNANDISIPNIQPEEIVDKIEVDQGMYENYLDNEYEDINAFLEKKDLVQNFRQTWEKVSDRMSHAMLDEFTKAHAQ